MMSRWISLNIGALLLLGPTASQAGEPSEDRYLNLIEATDGIVGQMTEQELQIAAHCQMQSFLAAHLLKSEPVDINVNVNQKVHDTCNRFSEMLIEGPEIEEVEIIPLQQL